MRKEHKPTFHNRGPLYFEQDGTPKKCKECGSSGPIEHGLCDDCVTEMEHEFNARLACGGIEMTEDIFEYKSNLPLYKDKITYPENYEDGRLFLVEKLIKWIQETQCEMDLQTKTSKKIAIEYYEDIENRE